MLIKNLSKISKCPSEPELKTTDIEEELKMFAGKKYQFLQTYHTLKDFKHGERKLPLLDFSLRNNDFLPVLAMMLGIIMSSVWLSAKSMESGMLKFGPTNGRLYLDALRHHLTFLFPDNHGEVPFGNTVLLYAAIWLPFFAMLISGGFDFWTAIRDEQPIIHGYAIIGLRWAFLLFWGTLAFIFAISGTVALKSVKGIIYPAKHTESEP